MRSTLIRRLNPAVAVLGLWLCVQGVWAKSQDKTTDEKAGPEEAVSQVIKAYHLAMEARSTDRLGAVMDPQVLVLEGTYKNVGWPDYRDNHIGPEMKDWKEFKIADPKILEVLVSGDLAYAVQEASLTIVTAEKTILMSTTETFVLRKGPNGWKIKHIHYSGKKREQT